MVKYDVYQDNTVAFISISSPYVVISPQIQLTDKESDSRLHDLLINFYKHNWLSTVNVYQWLCNIYPHSLTIRESLSRGNDDRNNSEFQEKPNLDTDTPPSHTINTVLPETW